MFIDDFSEARSIKSNVTIEEAFVESEDGQSLAKSESNAVNRSKRLVYLVLILAAGAVGIGTYFYVKREENLDFEQKFESYAEDLLEGAERNAKAVFGELLTLGKSMTSFMISQQENSLSAWPNATLPQFDIRTTSTFESIIRPELFLFAPIVKSTQKKAWEDYAWEHQDYLRQELDFKDQPFVDPGEIPRRIYPFFAEDDYDLDEIETYAPLWQIGPVPTNASALMLDLYSLPSFRRMIDEAMEVRHILLSQVFDPDLLLPFERIHQENWDESQQEHQQQQQKPFQHARSYGLQPVFDSFSEDASVVGILSAVVSWKSYFLNVLAEGTTGLLVEVQDTCDSRMTYKVTGPDAEYLGQDLLHDSEFDDLKVSREFATFARFDGVFVNEFIKHCDYTISAYPTDEFRAMYQSNDPIIFALALIAVFFITAMVFALYDCMVQRRQQKVMATANRTNALVTSLFPKEVQDRILDQAEAATKREKKEPKKWKTFGLAPKTELNNFLHDDNQGAANGSSEMLKKSRPIADLFPSASVIFADLVGFTAWSSVRDPSQVFILLETLYNAFDAIAKIRGVYKVETIGDCWVGTCGLPASRPDHAVCITRFGRDILKKMGVLVKHLEVELGPDTTELGIRIGIHSGPVTAGVLRGERARFQLFGDTVNTASRMESNGKKNMIHISSETASLLITAGKAHWIRQREDKIVAKGKGELTTFWVQPDGSCSATTSSSLGNDSMSCDGSGEMGIDGGAVVGTFMIREDKEEQTLPEKYRRLVAWIADVLVKHLRGIAARRAVYDIQPDTVAEIQALEESIRQRGLLVIDELEDIVCLPDWKQLTKKKNLTRPKLSGQVLAQLHEYLCRIVEMYRDNPFHNIEHAAHVTMSVSKLLSRIVRPDVDNATEDLLHDNTYGLTADPLTQFTVILSALVHDVDHPGVPNATLIDEDDPLADQYRQTSMAEQRSVNVAWEILLEDRFGELRQAIYSTTDELKRFRQLLVNTVLATDIADKRLSAARKQRWATAFAEEEYAKVEDPLVARNRKATIVIEHLIQASDVAHTMQHWQIYRRWNERFFFECMKAYKEGRMKSDPAESWYQGEIGFFDFYIIPLAKKLNECGVFGVSSDEYLSYAMANRQEWEVRGQEVVKELIEREKSSVDPSKANRRGSSVY